MNVFTVFGNAMVNGKTFYEDHITFTAASFDDAVEMAKVRYMSRNSDDSIIDDFIPISVMNGYYFQDDVEFRKI